MINFIVGLVLGFFVAYLVLGLFSTAREDKKRHGHWKDNRNGTFTCSVCGGQSSKMDFCGRCGAYMRGDNYG